MQSFISPFIQFSQEAQAAFGEILHRNRRITPGSSYVYKKKITDKRTYKPLHGQFGIFASKNIKIGQELVIYTGKYVSQREFNTIKKEDLDYVYRIEPDDEKATTWFIVPNGKGLAEFVNDGRRTTSRGVKKYNNGKFVEKYWHGFPIVTIEATKRIKKNDQIFVDYGDAYWKS